MLYIHVPFCSSFCIYCDFYSEICSRSGDVHSYADALCREIRSRSGEIRATEQTNTLYIGGGTPSVLPLDVFSRIVGCLQENGIAGPWEEFTVEVNPDDIVRGGRQWVEGLTALGVNRISMGVQSLDDGVLKWMNRRHDAAGAHEAFRTLREAGVGNVSVDLIFGIGGVPGDVLPRAVEEVLQWRPEHISAYQLSVEEGTALHKLMLDGRYEELPDDACAREYDFLCRRLSEAGYVHYEISNWALPGREARHNSAYWRREPYVGLGPGAHSFDGGFVRSWNTSELSGWRRESEVLTPGEVREEQLMLGLRTSGGVPAGLCNAAELPHLLDEGLLEALPGASVRIPESRFFVADGVIERVL